MPEGFDQFAKGVGKAIETIPEIYDDALKPTTKESGKVLSLIPRTINAALVPLRQWIANKEYNLAETEKLLTKKLEHVSEEKIVTPEPYVAVPAIQAISYSMNSKELRNLYANLLAKSMNSDTKDLVHPSFIEIIRQMSPIDAQIFSNIINKPIRPLISIEITSSDGGKRIFVENCSWITNISLSKCRASFNNLSRLGLIEIPFDGSYTCKKNYDIVKSNPLFVDIESECKNNLTEGESVFYNEKYIKLNELSNLFNEICIKNP